MSDSKIIFPRSPKETMSGWVYLPRFVDKIRLHLAGRLDADYEENFCVRGFDAAWLKAAGLTAEAMIAVVKATLTDGEVADWVENNVSANAAARAAFRDFVLNHGREQDENLRAVLRARKEKGGFANRDDIQTFVEFIDADEKRGHVG